MAFLRNWSLHYTDALRNVSLWCGPQQRWMQTEINFPSNRCKNNCITSSTAHPKLCSYTDKTVLRTLGKMYENCLRIWWDSNTAKGEIQKRQMKAMNGHIQRTEIWGNKSGSVNRYLKQKQNETGRLRYYRSYELRVMSRAKYKNAAMWDSELQMIWGMSLLHFRVI